MTNPISYLPNGNPDQLDLAQVMRCWEQVHRRQATALEVQRAYAFYIELKHLEGSVVQGLTPITELQVNPRTHFLLKRYGVNTVEQLRAMKWGEVLEVPGIGVGKADAIREALGRLSRKRAAA